MTTPAASLWPDVTSLSHVSFSRWKRHRVSWSLRANIYGGEHVETELFNPCWNVDTEKLLPPIYLNDIEKSLYMFNSNHRPHSDGKTAENCEMLVIRLITSCVCRRFLMLLSSLILIHFFCFWTKSRIFCRLHQVKFKAFKDILIPHRLQFNTYESNYERYQYMFTFLHFSWQ